MHEFSMLNLPRPSAATPQTSLTRILIADDHPLFREALRYVVEQVFPKNHIVEARSYPAALAYAGDQTPFDMVFVDLMMPGGSESLEELANLRGLIPSTPIVVVSSREDWPIIRRVLALGVAGYIPKSAPRSQMEAAIRGVLAGDVYAPFDSLRESPLMPHGGRSEPLTPRQAAVLEHLARGSSNRQIAHDLCIEEITVKAHISAILRKLHVKNRLEAVIATRTFSERMGDG
jgi:DNA-binding NarL/FixJ family response regulator